MTATFPEANLGAAVGLYLGAAQGWTDVTGYVYQRDPVQITRGRADESTQVNPSQCTLTFNNQDDRFSLNNPTSPYYGLLNRNTPIRVSVPNALLASPGNTTYLRLEDDGVSFASTPAVAGIELTGSIDVRLDVQLSGWGNLALASIWGAATGVNQRSWMFGAAETGQLFLCYSTNGTNIITVLSDIRLPIAVGRQGVRVTLDATTGNVTFYTAPGGSVDAGPWTQIGATIPGTGAVTLFASTTQPLIVGYSAGFVFDWLSVPFGHGNGPIAAQGAIYDLELRSGTATVVAHPSFLIQTAGATTWTDNHGLVWSLTGTAELSNRSYRYHGELSQTPKAADPSGTDVYSQATASGVLRRLGQAQTPLNSALYRAYLRADSSHTLAAYWPCEDGPQATQIASGLPGGQALQISGSPQMSSNTQLPSSAALPVLNGSVWRSPVPAGGTWTQTQMQLVVVFPASASSETDEEVIASLFTAGAMARMDLRYGVAGVGSLNVVGYNAAGTQLFASAALVPAGSGVTGSAMLVNFGLQLSGSTVQWTVTMYPRQAGGASQFAGTATGAAIAPVSSVAVNTLTTCQQLAVGHIGVFASSTPNLIQQFNGWEGETAGARVQRLCTEEGIQARIVGHPELSIQMGPQSIQTLPNLLQECETTDRGMLFEPRTCLGIGYRTLYSMYNQQPAASVAYAGGQVDQGFASTADDQLTLNDVTVSNSDGSSARQILTSGTMSIQAPPNGVGRVDTQIQVNALSDGYLAGIAQWILHTSTDAHDRFPVIPFNLARIETPMAVALADVGDLVAVTAPPVWLQPDEIDQLASGFAETLGPYAVWQIDVNGIPAYPYTIASVAPAVSSAAAFTGGGFATHADTDGTTLGAALAPTDTTLTFVSLANYPAWTQNPADFPFEVNVAGERVTVVGPGTTLATDPLLANGTGNYVAHNGALTLSTSVGAPYAATGYSQSCLFATPAGSPSTFANILWSAPSAAGTIATSTGYTVWAWVYATAARTYNLLAVWYLNGTQVSVSTPTGTAVAAGTWTLITGTVTSPASGVNEVVLGVADNNAPTSAQTFGVWGLNAARTAGIVTASPQTMTGIRSRNGVVKAQASGTSVALWYRPVAGQLTGA